MSFNMSLFMMHLLHLPMHLVAPKPAVVAWHPSYLGSWLPKFAGKWHGDEFCLQNPEVLSTKSSYSFKIHPDLRISLLVIQTKFHISSQEFQGNVSVVGGEVHKFHHLVNRKKIHKKPVPRLNQCHLLDEPFQQTTGLISRFVSKTTWQITLMSCPTRSQQISFPRRTPPFFLLGGGKDGTGTGFHGSPTLQVNAETGKQKQTSPR